MKSFSAHTLHREIFVPDTRVSKDDPSYVYVPLRGHAFVLAVFNKEDECIGYILTETLGFASVEAWMEGVRWVDQGY